MTSTTPTANIHVLTLTPFYPSLEDDASGCGTAILVGQEWGQQHGNGSATGLPAPQIASPRFAGCRKLFLFLAARGFRVAQRGCVSLCPLAERRAPKAPA